MSLRHPERIKMSPVKFRSSENFLRVHNQNCSGKFVVDKDYKGTAMSKAQCPQCGGVGFIVRTTPGGQNFEGYLPASFMGSLKFTEAEFRTFPCKQCGETLDQPVNNGKVTCPVCGEQQFKPNTWSNGNQEIISK